MMKTKRVLASFLFLFILSSLLSCKEEEKINPRWGKNNEFKHYRKETIKEIRKTDFPLFEIYYYKHRMSEKGLKENKYMNLDKSLYGLEVVRQFEKPQTNNLLSQKNGSRQNGELEGRQRMLSKITDEPKSSEWIINSPLLIPLGIVCFLIIYILVLFLIFVKLNRRKKEILELSSDIRKLQERIKTLEIQSSSMNEKSYSFSSSTLGSLNLNKNHTPLQSAKVIEKKSDDLLNLISPLYSDQKGRDKRKTSGEPDIYLDIASVMYTKMQRNERITSVILEQQGSWRNSMFVLNGQSLYVNFHLYNEDNPFSFLETENIAKLLHLIYDIEGNGRIITCKPATVNAVSNSYCVIKKGKLVLA